MKTTYFFADKVLQEKVELNDSKIEKSNCEYSTDTAPNTSVFST